MSGFPLLSLCKRIRYILKFKRDNIVLCIMFGPGHLVSIVLTSGIVRDHNKRILTRVLLSTSRSLRRFVVSFTFLPSIHSTGAFNNGFNSLKTLVFHSASINSVLNPYMRQKESVQSFASGEARPLVKCTGRQWAKNFPKEFYGWVVDVPMCITSFDIVY